jgi:hypothetical protein
MKKVSLMMKQRPHRPKKARLFYTPSHGPDGNWVDESPIPSFVTKQNCQYKPLRSELIRQEEIAEDSDATVIMEDDPSLDTFSPTGESRQAGINMAGVGDRGTEESIQSLVTRKPYEYERVWERLDEQERIAKCKETVLVKDIVTLDTSKPSEEEEANHTHVQQLEKWIKGSVQQTILGGSINFNALGRAVEKHITESVASWYWDIPQQKQCPGEIKKDWVEGTRTSVKARISIATMQEVVEKQIVNAIDLDELKSTAMGIILNNQERGEGVIGMVEKEGEMMRK